MKCPTGSAICRFLLGSATLLLSQTAIAAGFYLSEVGTPGSLGTAGVANPTNTYGADASWTNPAGMTGLQQDTMVGGLQFILPKVEFDSSVATSGGSDGGNAGNPLAAPSFFYVKPLSDDLRFGFSVAGIQGGGVDYGDSFVGRYSVSMAELGAIGFSPSIGYRVSDRLSVGAGVSIVYTRFDEDIMLDPAVIPGGTVNGLDGKLKIEKATDWGYQPFLGLTYQLSDRALLGVVYRAEMDVELEGDVKVRNLNLPIAADSVDIDWDNPQWLEAGLRYQLDDKNTLFLDAGWQEWSAFSTNTLEFSGGRVNPSATLERNFDDTWHAGIAFVHNEGDHGTSIGFSYDSSPVDDKDRTLDLPFDEIYKLSFAYGWKGDKHLDFSVGGTLYLMGDAKINQTSIGPPAEATTVIGEFDTNTILFVGATARYLF
jgi:long-chain fatty acid transport protein